MNRAQTDIEATRERLVEIATAMLEERGSTALTMQELAIRAGMSPATVYRYFEDKDALLQAMSTEVGRRFPYPVDTQPGWRNW